MRKFTIGLLGAMAVATTALLVRQQREVEGSKDVRLIPAGETRPVELSLERIRELGL